MPKLESPFPVPARGPQLHVAHPPEEVPHVSQFGVDGATASEFATLRSLGLEREADRVKFGLLDS